MSEIAISSAISSFFVCRHYCLDKSKTRFLIIEIFFFLFSNPKKDSFALK